MADAGDEGMALPLGFVGAYCLRSTRDVKVPARLVDGVDPEDIDGGPADPGPEWAVAGALDPGPVYFLADDRNHRLFTPSRALYEQVGRDDEAYAAWETVGQAELAADADGGYLLGLPGELFADYELHPSLAVDVPVDPVHPDVRLPMPDVDATDEDADEGRPAAEVGQPRLHFIHTVQRRPESAAGVADPAVYLYTAAELVDLPDRDVDALVFDPEPDGSAGPSGGGDPRVALKETQKRWVAEEVLDLRATTGRGDLMFREEVLTLIRRWTDM